MTSFMNSPQLAWQLALQHQRRLGIVWDLLQEPLVHLHIVGFSIFITIVRVVILKTNI